MKEWNDKQVFELIKQETKRQATGIELIASENFVSKEILMANGSILTNKYAEGYPGKRYYDGCEFVDEIERLAIERLKKLFNVKYANVQPHSGSQANAAAIAALILPNQKIMGMALDSGGHLTHGHKITFSGTFYQVCNYEVNQDGWIDYDEVERIAIKEQPALIICGFSSYSRQVDFKRFAEIAKKVHAKLLADIAHIAGLVAVGLHPSPIGYADVITSTVHKTLRGTRGGIIMTNDEVLAKKIDRWVFPGMQGGPLVHVVAAKAITFYEALQPEFQTYIKNVCENARAFAAAFQKLGVEVISGGTDTHLFSINVFKTYRVSGLEASNLLAKNHIFVNKNAIPRDELGPSVASGIRLGTPAMTTLGFEEVDFVKTAQLIHEVLANRKSVKSQVAKLLSDVKMRNSHK